MDHVEPDELPELGERFAVAVDPEEAEDLAARVNDRLDALAPLAGVPMPAPDPVEGDRTWREPDDDPLNAVAVECAVEPNDGGGPLAGIDVGVKDIVAVAGLPMQCGSPVMAGFVPGFDATVVRRLLEADALITAKTTLDEFAGSPTGTTGTGGPVRNPADPERTAGGSSGGSAVVVATGRVDAAIGSDTGGSIRVPASYCGVVGLKPTYGLVPLRGVVENTYTQDHLGPLTPDVETAARVLEAIAGADERDPASLGAAGRPAYRVGGYLEAVRDPPVAGDLSIGVLTDGLGDGIDAAVEARFEGAIDSLASAGARIERVSVDGFEHGRAIKDAISLVELAAHWRAGGAAFRRGGLVDPDYQAELAGRSRDRSDELSDFYRAKLLAGARVIESADGVPYTRAQAAREVLREEFEEALSDVDVLALPTTPTVAPRLEDAEDGGIDHVRNTRAADVTRLPAISLPGGEVEGLPIGFQLVGAAFREDQLLGVSSALEHHAGG